MKGVILTLEIALKLVSGLKIAIISMLNYKIRQNIVKIKHLLKIDNLALIYI